MGVFHLAKAGKRVRVLGLLIVAVLGMTAMFVQPRAIAAVSFGGPFDCNNNAVINCGAKDVPTLVSAYNSQSSVRAIYNSFGISSSDIQSIGDTAVAGTVTKSGDVYVGNQLVATNVTTAGRQNIPGSTKVTSDGVTFYKRAPSVSFSNNSLTAYVVMHNGQFQFAILSACGNPVTGTPKPPVKATLACKQLLLTPGVVEKNGDQAYTFSTSADVSNGSITSYVFDLGNGSTQTVNTGNTSAQSSSHTYAPGTYHVSVTVNGVAGNVYTSAPTPVTCTGDFTVKANGTLACVSLTLNTLSTSTTTGDVSYTLTARATAKDATISKYVFSFGDDNGTTQTVTTSDTSATSQNVTYAAGKTYKSIFVTVYGTSSNGNTIVSGGAASACATNMTIPPQTCATGSTADSCKPTCTAPNGQTYPVGSSECTPTPPVVTTSTPPTTTLPNTGAGNVIGLFFGVVIAAAAAHRLLKRNVYLSENSLI